MDILRNPYGLTFIQFCFYNILYLDFREARRIGQFCRLLATQSQPLFDRSQTRQRWWRHRPHVRLEHRNFGKTGNEADVPPRADLVGCSAEVVPKSGTAQLPDPSSQLGHLDAGARSLVVQVSVPRLHVAPAGHRVHDQVFTKLFELLFVMVRFHYVCSSEGIAEIMHFRKCLGYCGNAKLLSHLLILARP